MRLFIVHGVRVACPACFKYPTGAVCVFIMLAIFSLSCNEALPPHTEPQTLFNGVIYGVYLSKYQSLYITMTVKSTFDETLQDIAGLTGTLEIVLADAPEYRKTVTIDRSMFTAYRLYDSQTGLLTVNPGDSLSFVYQWNFITDGGVSLPADAFVKLPDNQFPGRFVSPPETFIMSGFIQVFTRIGQVTLQPVKFVMIYDFSA